MYRVFNLKVDRIFNMSNLFTKIYNMLYYTTNLYLQQVLEIMSIHFNALIDTFHHVPRNFYYHSFIFNHFRNSAFYWHLPSKFFKETLCTVDIRHCFLNNFPK